ncbi:pimeloyl-ACP methyl ester carboxylesterase [Sphingomonas vulcanisoli]|uniref:Pimeloyl-ACP methyl ester carboxylesterase n=1 Tax=Sphingomonas vulcanisoli TaxID=1658060 RepID=A0ABX0TWZ5_9SPHN|nr:alpha/beta hydrolase [Sphingomonas vulcanisoli]NIJ09224.1 pimeloyl-ACP methyl ester carboxylesterase [Sphingomonas vulcanisoli]
MALLDGANSNNSGLTDEGLIRVPGLLSRYVKLANGAKAHYMTSGEDGPAVILLHGGIDGSSGTAGWRFMAPMLGANGFRVYCPDRPGYGLSDISKPEFLVQDRKANVDFVTMFADALGIDKFHIGGNSAGGVICADYAVHNPERLLSIAFIACDLGDIAPQFPNIMKPAEGKFTPNPGFTPPPPFDGTDESMKVMMESIIYAKKAVSPELVAMRANAARRQREARPGETAQSRRRLLNANPNMKIVFTTKDRIDKLDIPMIYMYGMQDVMAIVENGFVQEDKVPNVQFFYPDECGHQGQTDQPDLFNDVFLEFFRDGKVSWETAQRAKVSRRRPINPDRVEEPAGGFPKPVPDAYVDYPTLMKALAE